MKAHEDELEEMIDLTIKLTWNHAVFLALFEKNEVVCEPRQAHPEFFITLHDSLLCGFCVTTAILFEEKTKATSFWSLVRKSKPDIAEKLTRKIYENSNIIKKIKDLRNQACAHRLQAKTAQDVFAEVRLHINTMTDVANLARFIICELVGSDRKEELERQWLSDRTLQCIVQDANQVMRSFQQIL